MGFLSGSQFNLVVSLRFTPAAGEMGFWCQLLEQVSRIIHDSTDGELSIGQMLISPNSMGGKDADIWVHLDSDVWSNSTGARLWFPFESIDVPQDHMFYPTILAHELAHYLYDLRDEYNNGSTCLGNIATQASIMEGYPWTSNTRWTDGAGADFPDWDTFFPAFTGGTAVLQNGQPSEFCHAGNHNATADNNQNNINGNQSCWTYMANDANHNGIPYGLVAPGRRWADAGRPRGASGRRLHAVDPRAALHARSRPLRQHARREDRPAQGRRELLGRLRERRRGARARDVLRVGVAPFPQSPRCRPPRPRRRRGGIRATRRSTGSSRAGRPRSATRCVPA